MGRLNAIKVQLELELFPFQVTIYFRRQKTVEPKTFSDYFDYEEFDQSFQQETIILKSKSSSIRSKVFVP